MRAVSAVALVAVLLAAAAVPAAQGFVFHLPAKAYRCFTDEVPTGIEANISYAALPGYGQYIDVRVTDSKNKIVHEDIATDRGQFYVPAGEGGDYAICFNSRMVSGLYPSEGDHRAVRLNFNVGSDSVDYDTLASVKHMKPMEVDLRVVEDIVRNVHGQYEYFKVRELAMRDTSEHMNTKITVMTIALMIGFALFAWWQLRHLTKYFKRKRMLD
jgi:hypothetical protein